jgi:hypothetical protein
MLHAMPYSVAIMKKIVFLFQSAAFSLLVASSWLLLAGCSTPAESNGLRPVGFKVVTQHSASVIVHTEGGAQTDRLGNPEIAAPAFREALMAAVNESRIFSSVRDQPPADYRLSVSVVTSKPDIGLTTHEKVSARWELTRLSDNSVRFNEFVTTSGKATAGDALTMWPRMRIALERAGQENIRQGLTKLAALNLN